VSPSDRPAAQERQSGSRQPAAGPDAVPRSYLLTKRGQAAWTVAERARLQRLARYQGLVGVAAVVLVIAVWQLITSLHLVAPIILPGPSAIAIGLYQYATSPDFPIDLATSGEELAIGFGLAILIGLPAGILMGWYRLVFQIFDPFVSFFYSTPRIALVPLLIIWFGIGIWSKVAVIYLGAFFPIAINTLVGVRSLDPDLLRCARSFGATDLQLFRTIALPGAVPFILTGLRLGVGHALIGVVVGELVAAQHGVGYEMNIFGTTYQMAKMFAALFIIAVAGAVLQAAFQRLERRFDAWRVSAGRR
jgi:ABC-type nitrate/sulfonate/bicarbonate transport system permease component